MQATGAERLAVTWHQGDAVARLLAQGGSQ